MAALRPRCTWRELHHLKVGQDEEAQVGHARETKLALRFCETFRMPAA